MPKLSQQFFKAQTFSPSACWISVKYKFNLPYYCVISCWDGFLCFAVSFGNGNISFLFEQQKHLQQHLPVWLNTETATVITSSAVVAATALPLLQQQQPFLSQYYCVTPAQVLTPVGGTWGWAGFCEEFLSAVLGPEGLPGEAVCLHKNCNPLLW